MILTAKNLYKSFTAKAPIDVLKDVSLQVRASETVAIMGRSGEGKSTLLHVLGTLEPPTKGSVSICNQTDQTAHIRNHLVGFIFQSYHLLEDFTVLENVLMPLQISRNPDVAFAQTLLDEVGLKNKAEVLAKFLSGGEKQRVAIARALANQPKLLLADEPTGNLDDHHSQEIEDLLLNSAKKHNAALIVVTHDERFANKCDRLLLLKDGQLYNQQK